jgi:hypothetical protein
MRVAAIVGWTLLLLIGGAELAPAQERGLAGESQIFSSPKYGEAANVCPSIPEGVFGSWSCSFNS